MKTLARSRSGEHSHEEAFTHPFTRATAAMEPEGVARSPDCNRPGRAPHRCCYTVSRARSGIEKDPMKHTESVIQSDLDIMGGTPVFVGTRVPFQTLLDYLESGQPLAEFLDDFPTVSRDQAVAALEQAKEALFARARTA
jgi:uncharacterized protein (DUF433 family)